MLGLKPISSVNHQPSGTTGASSLLVNQRPAELSAKNLTDFLNQPRRTRLKATHDLGYFAPFEIVARSKGRIILGIWLENKSPFRAIHELQTQATTIDILQLTVVTGRERLVSDRWRAALGAKQDGRFGLEIALHGTTHRISPLQTIATNRTLSKFFEALLEQKHLTSKEFFAVGGQLNLLECRQFVLKCGKPALAIETYRGNRLIAVDEPPEKLTERLISGIARWFMSNQNSEGGLPYKYWPSSGVYSKADNPIRQFMASVAFNRMALALERQDMRLAARKNLEFNLRRFYRSENEKGVIAWSGSVKLGALALAALAILESPFADSWRTELAQLRQTINTLWQPSGAFNTFLRPEGRNDNQNFYPGEALLFWAISLQGNRDEALLAQAMKSFQYYRSHFRKNSNPAFVPWHSQAAVIFYNLTGDAGVRDFIFEMNDWLLPHQQWGGALESGLLGPFLFPG